MNTYQSASSERRPDDAREFDGIVTVCASCKKLRDSRGNWTAAEMAPERGGKPRISHSICPVCLRELYPEFKEHHKTAAVSYNDFVIQPCG